MSDAALLARYLRGAASYAERQPPGHRLVRLAAETADRVPMPRTLTPHEARHWADTLDAQEFAP